MKRDISRRRRPRRKIVCRSDGSMFDVEQRRRISVEELRNLLIGGENFEAETEETGRDCTVEVLQRVMSGAPSSMSGLGGLPLPTPGAFGAFTDLMGLVRAAGDRPEGAGRDERWEDRPGPRRRRGRATGWTGEIPPDGGGSG